MERKDILLKAAYDILKIQAESMFVIHVLSQEVVYEGDKGVVNDGYSLMNDIAEELGIDE